MQYRKTKVCLAITKGVWGGAQEYVYTLATTLPKDQFDIFVLCGEGHTLQDKLQSVGIRTYTLPKLRRDVSFLAEIESFFTLFSILRKERPDVLHTNSSKMGFLGALAGRLAGIPHIVFTAHGWAFNEKRSQLIRDGFYFIHWITLLLSHQTIAVSEKTKRDVSGMPLVQDKIHLIYNGLGVVDFFNKEVARGEIAQIVGGPVEAEILIGTISELHKNKGLDLLIEASENLPENTAVYIIGDGEEKANLIATIEKHDLRGKIFFIGRVDNARKLLKAFDIFTLTSRTESLPYTIMEAGLAGCAVLASRVGGIPEIIEDGESGLLTEPTILDIKNKLKYLLEHQQERKMFGQKLKRKIEEDFSLTKMVEKTVKLYSK